VEVAAMALSGLTDVSAPEEALQLQSLRPSCGPDGVSAMSVDTVVARVEEALLPRA
jgi:hypothetical protein